MKTSLKFLAVAICAFTAGSLLNNYALSALTENYKVAVVDVTKVVSTSSQVNALKADRSKKVQDLAAFIEKAKADVDAEKDPIKKKTLEDGYNKELNLRKSTMDKDYAQKLSDIDTTISGVISTKAKADGYNLVLAKGVVLYGGTDITSDVATAVK